MAHWDRKYQKKATNVTIFLDTFISPSFTSFPLNNVDIGAQSEGHDKTQVRKNYVPNPSFLFRFCFLVQRIEIFANFFRDTLQSQIYISLFVKRSTSNDSTALLCIGFELTINFSHDFALIQLSRSCEYPFFLITNDANVHILLLA